MQNEYIEAVLNTVFLTESAQDDDGSEIMMGGQLLKHVALAIACRADGEGIARLDGWQISRDTQLSVDEAFITLSWLRHIGLVRKASPPGDSPAAYQLRNVVQDCIGTSHFVGWEFRAPTLAASTTGGFGKPPGE